MLSEYNKLSKDLLMFIRAFLLNRAFLPCFLLINQTIDLLTNFYFDQYNDILQYLNLRC